MIHPGNPAEKGMPFIAFVKYALPPYDREFIKKIYMQWIFNGIYFLLNPDEDRISKLVMDMKY